MFLRKNASSEIEAAFQEAIVKNAVEEQTSGLTKVAEAMDLVCSAAEIFDSVGLHKEAEVMTLLLECLAAKKKKKKATKKKKDEDEEEEETKSSKSKKKVDEATKDLTSDKMEDNLKHKGWVFNADDNDADDNFVFTPFKRPSITDEKQTPSYWRERAKHWYNKALQAEQKGNRFDSRIYYNKGEECSDKADMLASSMHVNDADDNWTHEKDDEYYAKDEREASLAQIMHEIEESTRQGPELSYDPDDEWDFPMHKNRSPRRF